MMRRLPLVTALLLVGAIIDGALYWTFLNTPESSLAMLVLSAALILLMVISTAVTWNTALRVAIDEPLGPSLRRGVRAIPWFVVVGLAYVALLIAVRRTDEWLIGHRGEIHAWFIMKANWADVGWLFTVERHLSRWLQVLLLPSAGLAIVATAMSRGRHGVFTWQWARAAWRWQTMLLGVVTLESIAIVINRLGYWRPATLPPTWVQPVFALLRLSLLACLVALGCALVLATIARRIDATRPPSSS